MVILDGEVTMTIADETLKLRAGDVVGVNRGVEHALFSRSGVTFLEALAPVPLDHIPDRERDLVLGPRAGRRTSSADPRWPESDSKVALVTGGASGSALQPSSCCGRAQRRA